MIGNQHTATDGDKRTKDKDQYEVVLVKVVESDGQQEHQGGSDTEGQLLAKTVGYWCSEQYAHNVGDLTDSQEQGA